MSSNAYEIEILFFWMFTIHMPNHNWFLVMNSMFLCDHIYTINTNDKNTLSPIKPFKKIRFGWHKNLA